MSSADLTLLQQPPSSWINDAVAAKLDPSSGVVMDDLTLTLQPGKVVITPTQASYVNPSWNYFGHAIATYDPIDMENVFGTWPMSLVPPQVPGRSGDIATLLAEIFDVLIAPADVVDVPLPPVLGGGTVFVLQASPSSVMWKGQRTITLYPMSVIST